MRGADVRRTGVRLPINGIRGSPAAKTMTARPRRNSAGVNVRPRASLDQAQYVYHPATHCSGRLDRASGSVVVAAARASARRPVVDHLGRLAVAGYVDPTFVYSSEP